MISKYVVNWYKENHEGETIRVGAGLLFSLSNLMERSNLFKGDGGYIASEIIPDVLERLREKGWSEVIIGRDFLDFIRDLDDILTILSFRKSNISL